MSTPLALTSFEQASSLLNQQVGISDWVTITQRDIDQFADLIEDHQWIHIDLQRARAESPFGTTIAHGFLTLSQLTRLAVTATEVQLGAKTLINYGFNKVRFVSPVASGARVRGHFVLGAIRKLEAGKGVGAGYELQWNVTVEVEGNDKPAIAAEWLVRGYE